MYNKIRLLQKGETNMIGIYFTAAYQVGKISMKEKTVVFQKPD